MPILEIKLKSGENFEIFFQQNDLITRKMVNPETGQKIQIFTNVRATYSLTFKEEEIASVEKRDGVIIGLPNRL